MPKMSKFRMALRLQEKAYRHLFKSPYIKIPKDDAREFMREVNYEIKNQKRKGHIVKIKGALK